MKQVSIEELAKYSDRYIGLTRDRTKIVASGKTIKILIKKLDKLGDKDAVITYIPPIDKALTLIWH